MKPANDNRIELYVSSIARVLAGFFLSISLTIASGEAGNNSADFWFESDFEEQTENVNEGLFARLLQPPAMPVHEHINKIRISSSSLKDGWVTLQQCHRNLDAVPALQIVFSEDRIRALKLVKVSGMGNASVVDNTVQLEDISTGSELCLTAETRAIRFEKNTIRLENGPYMRRFLDGYYPMRVSLLVEFPADELIYLSATPVAFEASGQGAVALDIWFEGRLNTSVVFRRK